MLPPPPEFGLMGILTSLEEDEVARHPQGLVKLVVLCQVVQPLGEQGAVEEATIADGVLAELGYSLEGERVKVGVEIGENTKGQVKLTLSR